MALQIPDLASTLRVSTPVATLANLQAEAQQRQDAAAETKQRLSEGQLNLQRLQQMIDQTNRDQQENEQIKSRIARGGSPDDVYKDLLAINPDKARAYITNARADDAAKRAEALQNYNLNPNPIMPMQSMPQAPAQVAAPQLTTAPIPASLPGQPAQTSQPQTAPQENVPILRNVNLPNKWTMAPAPDVTIPSATGGAPLVIPGQNRDQAIAAQQAAEQHKARLQAEVEQNKPLVIGEGGTAVIPDLNGGAPSIIHGQPKLSDIEKEAAPWLAQNPGKTLPDYVKQKAADVAASSEYGQKLAAFNANPALVKQFGPGPNGLSAKEQADQIKIHASEAAQTVAAQQALQGGAVKNVAPHLVTPATEAYAKDSKAYVDSAQAADDMATFISDAKAGNKVAYSFIPAEGALYLTTSRGVKRINLNEMNAYSGGGSAWDRFMGYIGKQTSGASIPPNILDDMQKINQSVGQNAKTAYQRKVAVTNQAFGSTFQPMDFGGQGSAGSLDSALDAAFGKPKK